MRYDLLEKYSGLDSVIHRLNPKTKIILFIFFIFGIVLTPPEEYARFIYYTVAVLCLILLSKVPAMFVLKRSLVVLPFVLLVVVSVPFMEGNSLIKLWNVLIKSSLSVLLMVLLTSTTPYQRLMKGFQELRMPKIFILIISFMYRYIYITVEEIYRMRRARDSRAPLMKRREHFKTAGNIIGALFIKSFERGERIYKAMLARGFTGEIKTLSREKLGLLDYAFTSIFLIFAILIFFI